jgi:hypothetical protein
MRLQMATPKVGDQDVGDQVARGHAVRAGEPSDVAREAFDVGCPHTDRLKIEEPTSARASRLSEIPRVVAV